MNISGSEDRVLAQILRDILERVSGKTSQPVPSLSGSKRKGGNREIVPKLRLDTTESDGEKIGLKHGRTF